MLKREKDRRERQRKSKTEGKGNGSDDFEVCEALETLYVLHKLSMFILYYSPLPIQPCLSLPPFTTCLAVSAT